MTMHLKRLGPIVFVVVFSLFLGTVIDAGYYYMSGRGLWRPAIVCEEPVRELGDVSDAKSISCDFLVRNAGSRPLQIEAVKPACGACVEVLSFPRQALQPGQSELVRVALLTKSLRGNVAKNVWVVSNDPRRPSLVVTVKAHVRPIAGPDKPASERAPE